MSPSGTRAVAVCALLAAILPLTAFVAFARAYDFDVGRLADLPSIVGTDRASAVRVAGLLDMSAYLVVAPVVVYLHRRLCGRSPELIGLLTFHPIGEHGTRGGSTPPKKWSPAASAAHDCGASGVLRHDGSVIHRGRRVVRGRPDSPPCPTPPRRAVGSGRPSGLREMTARNDVVAAGQHTPTRVVHCPCHAAHA